MGDSNNNPQQLVLVLGGTGKSGRRVVQQLLARGVSTRIGSRAAERPFDWDDASTWGLVLEDVSAAYIVFHPDLAVPGAPAKIQAFVDQAVEAGVRHLVLLSGRGEEEAQRCERIVQEADVDWTILRASWFAQNFSEGAFRDMVLAGTIALPADQVGEPFVDADDIADVAVAALTEPGHEGQLYELTGPRLLTFAEAAGEIAAGLGREIRYVTIPQEVFTSAMREQNVPGDFVDLLDYLFREVLDGRNAHLTDGVQRALGREPRDFTAFAHDTAASGAWNA